MVSLQEQFWTLGGQKSDICWVKKFLQSHRWSVRAEKSSYSIEDASDMTVLLVMSNIVPSGLFFLSLHAQEPENLTTQGTSLADEEPRCQFTGFIFQQWHLCLAFDRFLLQSLSSCCVASLLQGYPVLLEQVPSKPFLITKNSYIFQIRLVLCNVCSYRFVCKWKMGIIACKLDIIKYNH